jgi:hypothetical protein
VRRHRQARCCFSLRRCVFARAQCLCTCYAAIRHCQLRDAAARHLAQTKSDSRCDVRQ